MPIIRKEVSVPASGTIDNLVTGSIYEFMPFNAAINVGLTASATGLVGTINTGSDTLLEESPLNIKATFPIIPDEMDLQDRTLQGERLVVRIRNTTAGALTVRLLVQISPL